MVLSASGDVVTMNRDGSDPVTLAESGGQQGPLLAQPIWSPDARSVSFAATTAEGFRYVIHDLDRGESVSAEVDQFPFYAYWSPDGARVGLLRNGTTGVAFELVDTATGGLTAIGEGAPFYFSWSPDGADLVAHIGSDQLVRFDSAGTVDGESSTSPEYLAPQWLDRGVIHLEDRTIVVDEESAEPIAGTSGPATFVANRQGTRLAAQSLSDDPAISVALGETPTLAPNALTVIDLDSDDSSVASTAPAIGFFWSPDGESLLILTVDQARQGLTASVWSDGRTEEYATFVPHPNQVRDVYPFFPQYAQSMSYWSADSRSFAMVGAIDGEVGVWVQTLDGSDPTLVADGSWAAWSP